MMRKDTMLEKDRRCLKLDASFPVSCNSDKVKKEAYMMSNDTATDQCFNSGIASGSEYCSDVAILDVGCAVLDDNLHHHYSPSHMSQSEKDITFLYNDNGDKDINDIFYDGWPDIGNFEDIDKMFRSCDSTFGLAGLPTEEELCWFSSCHADQEPNATKSGFDGSTFESNGLKDVSEIHEASRLSSAVPSIAHKDYSSMSRNGILQAAESDSLHNEQLNVHKKKLKHENQSEGRTNDGYVENDDSFVHYDILDEFADVTHPLGDLISHDCSSTIQQHSLEHPGLTYVQGNMPNMYLGFGHPSNQFSVLATLSPGQSESCGDLYPSAKSSCASKNMFSMDSAHAPSYSCRAISKNEKEENYYHRRNIQPPSRRSNKCVDMIRPTTIYGQDHKQNQTVQSDGQISVEGAGASIQAELDSKNVQESSSTGSALKDMSLEATRFHQLQQVMEKLDIRTKLCIRDGLYRLARSAERRHICVDLNDCAEDCREANGALMARKTDKHTGFMDMETSTNPIDRSIAHLLFHNPLDASVVSRNNAASLKSPTVISAPIRDPDVVDEKQVCQEETSLMRPGN